MSETGNVVVSKETRDQCFHLIRHVKTDEEKQMVREALEGARVLGDGSMVMLYMEMLTGRCE